MVTPPTWRVAVVGFDHMHAGDQISVALAHPRAELVGVWDDDPSKVAPVADDLGLAAELRFETLDALLESARPDIVMVCSTTAEHEPLVRRLAQAGVHIVLEKPFAVSVQAAQSMIEAVNSASSTPKTLTLNWPLAWYPTHRTTRRLIAEGLVGDVLEVHYYDGNRGPLNHIHGKAEVGEATKDGTWWYSAEKGGGSLLDYLGYGVTLATWFRDGELPLSLFARSWNAPGLEVDEQSVVVATYAAGMSVFQTKWGTFTDPWTIQPYPRTGFTVVGTKGTILSEDYAAHVMVQTAEHPEPRPIAVDVLEQSERTALGYLIDKLEHDAPVEGPSSWQISLAGQVLVDAARESIRTGGEVQISRQVVDA